QGDGRQASHWKDNLGIGIMDPTSVPAGQANVVTTRDIQALDVIGWNVVLPSGPEIAVSFNGTNIADGHLSPSITEGPDFGAVPPGGTPVQRTFTVANIGTSTLTTSGLALPSGFTLVEGLSASILPGASDTFTVRLDTASLGTKSGQISFANND